MENNQPKSRRGSYKQTRQKKKRKLFMRWLAVSVLLFMVAVVSVVGYTFWKVSGALNMISSGNIQQPVKPGSTGQQEGEQPPGVEADVNKPFAVAIIGTDTRSGSGGTLNSDVLMVATVDTEKGEVHLLSVPRDLKVEIPGYSGFRKANMAYALGEAERRKQERNTENPTMMGPLLTMEMLANHFDIPIHYYVHVDFKGFEEVVDAVKGVKVDVQRSMIYDDPIDNTHINLVPGVQTLDGKRALDYVRHRLDNRGPSYYSSDFERNQRQQEVIRAIVQKLLSFDGVTNLGSVIDAIASHVNTNLSVEQMKELIWDLRSFSPERIITIENNAYWDSRQAFTVIKDEDLQQIKLHLKRLLESNL